MCVEGPPSPSPCPTALCHFLGGNCHRAVFSPVIHGQASPWSQTFPGQDGASVPWGGGRHQSQMSKGPPEVPNKCSRTGASVSPNSFKPSSPGKCLCYKLQRNIIYRCHYFHSFDADLLLGVRVSLSWELFCCPGSAGRGSGGGGGAGTQRKS